MCIKQIGLNAQNYASHSKLNGQHDWRDLYDHLMGMSILTMIMIIIRAPKIMGQMALIWTC